jgi:hypothetical protein
VLLREIMDTDLQAAEYERLPWHRPAVLRLTVNLDTGFESGSCPDGDGSTVYIEADGALFCPDID